MKISSLARMLTGALIVVSVSGLVPLRAAATDPPEALLANCGIDTSHVQITAAEGILFVRGTVPRRDAIEETSVILHESGYERVANLLSVATPPDDDTIRRSVERELVRTRALDGCRFRISALRGVVVLRGTVRRPLQRDLAVDRARSVKGVTEVVNALELASTRSSNGEAHFVSR